ncbi:hypothetical protein E2C01_034809 [Portunus trituberculatus]|uniref:Uncharacterized protein n=1 Tax=Portunus trituberculatus TaxID=210409 RepID=A0A5B7F3T8_PORTR|nr:hypothetical protein [Portunus trituberculatus]
MWGPVKAERITPRKHASNITVPRKNRRKLWWHGDYVTHQSIIYGSIYLINKTRPHTHISYKGQILIFKATANVALRITDIKAPESFKGTPAILVPDTVVYATTREKPVTPCTGEDCPNTVFCVLLPQHSGIKLPSSEAPEEPGGKDEPDTQPDTQPDVQRKGRKRLKKKKFSTSSIPPAKRSLPGNLYSYGEKLKLKIDKNWEKVCSHSPSWRNWWSSGKPLKLNKLVACTPSSPLEEDTSSSDGNSVDNGRATASAHEEGTSSSGGNDVDNDRAIATVNTISTSNDSEPTALTSNQERDNSSSSNNRRLPRFVTGRNRGDAGGVKIRASENAQEETPNQQQRRRGTNRCGQQEREQNPPNTTTRSSHPPPSTATRHPPRQGSSRHTQPTQRQCIAPRHHRKNAVCEYCSRCGHTIEECHSRAAELKQEQLLRRVIAEARQPAPAYLPPPPGLTHTGPQPSP